jgi:hypothetical protein
MIPLLDILIILSGLSAAQAGPMRRYANTTSSVVGAMTGVAYQPHNGSPSLSLAPIEGTARLPFSELAEMPAEAFVASSTAATSTVSFEYQPLESSETTNAETSSTTHNSQNDGIPTSFWTFGDQHIGTTITITSTTYTTVSSPPHAAGSSPSEEPQHEPTHAQSPTTTTSTHRSSQKFVYDPLPSPTDSSTTDSTTSTTSGTQGFDTTSTFANPYPSETSTHEPDLPGVTTKSPELPEVTTENAPATQTQENNVPGITIVPQHPSVIYITVTDAGATTTVTA